VTFYYEKDDGTVRKARGTVRHGISRKFDEYVYVKADKASYYEWPREDFTYWDLDKEQFRTFKASRLLKIEAYSAVNVYTKKSEKLWTIIPLERRMIRMRPTISATRPKWRWS